MTKCCDASWLCNPSAVLVNHHGYILSGSPHPSSTLSPPSNSSAIGADASLIPGNLRSLFLYEWSQIPSWLRTGMLKKSGHNLAKRITSAWKRLNNVINLHVVPDVQLCGNQATVKKLLSSQNEEISWHTSEDQFSLCWKQNCFGTENDIWNFWVYDVYPDARWHEGQSHLYGSAKTGTFRKKHIGEDSNICIMKGGKFHY